MKRLFKDTSARDCKWYYIWLHTYKKCTDSSYDGWNSYGAKGIKCYLKLEDARLLWERDRAVDMKRPSLGRICQAGNYELSNCFFFDKLKRKTQPWWQSYEQAKRRCLCKVHKNYNRYGGRGIKFLITFEEMGILWYRAKAYLMKRPSIHRINNDGHYEFSNCRFIEMTENSRLAMANFKHTEETKRKLRALRTGKPVSEETKSKLRFKHRELSKFRIRDGLGKFLGYNKTNALTYNIECYKMQS